MHFFADDQASQSTGDAPPPAPFSTITHTPSTPHPPPPPPIPTSQVPQAPPTPGAWLSTEESVETKPIVNHSRGVLQKMQHRLRSRMKKKGVCLCENLFISSWRPNVLIIYPEIIKFADFVQKWHD